MRIITSGNKALVSSIDMKYLIVIFFCSVAFFGCKKHKEKRLSGIYTGNIEYRHISVNNETGDTTLLSEEAYTNQQVQIARVGDEMVFVREMYALPFKEVKLNRTNIIEVNEDNKIFRLELDAFPDEILFIETIQHEYPYHYTYQIFDFSGFKD